MIPGNVLHLPYFYLHFSLVHFTDTTFNSVVFNVDNDNDDDGR